MRCRYLRTEIRRIWRWYYCPYAPRDSFPVDAPPLTFGAKIDIEASHIGTLRERLKARARPVPD
jgi:hypothetical protein